MTANPAIARLRAKVGRNGPDPKRLIAQAEKAVAGLTDSFHEWARRDLATLEEQLDSYAKGGKGSAETVRGMCRIIHDIKGQGGSFGYPLLTAIAASLGGYLKAEPREGGIDPRIVRAHIDAMNVVIRDRIEGDGGKIGARLTDELFALVERALARPSKRLVSQSGST